ncbi:MAG: hypothetical protein D6721_03210 [Gammaproteobacteria bacterium]|nr:MAG: hypothetical protein D6721_03210 [Gammaproteobacteria bacterium]
MSTPSPISDEQLNAFLDHQLDPEERERLLGVLEHDAELRRRACELRNLSELVRHAYDPRVLPRPRSAVPVRQRPWVQGVAAALLLGLGTTLGWFLHPAGGPGTRPPAIDPKVMYLDQERAFQTASLSEAPEVHGARKVLLHISSNDPRKMEAALDTAERLVRTYRARHIPVEVEVVANAGGLDLLRADVSPFADRIHALHQKYEELTFYACRTALSRLMAAKGLHNPPPLLEDALLTPNALDQILERLQEGWVYMSI